MGNTVPARMMAVGIAEPGGPQVLQGEERDVPVPGPGQVLVKVACAGVNRPDVLQRQGKYPPPPGAPDIPGLEIAGTVVALGDGGSGSESGLATGQQVCALVSGGGYAQYCLAQTDHCLPVPAGMPLDQAAAMPETLFTVWHNVFERGWACEGEHLLVHGGTSGIGTMAIALGRLFGLTVTVTCGSEDKCVAALAHGAHNAINYRQDDFVARVKDLTGGSGVDLVLDMVAGSYTQRNLDSLAESGRLVTIAVLGGAMAEVNMAKLMVRRQTMTGSTLRGRTDAFKALLADEIRRTVWPMVADGRLRPLMDRTFPLEQAAAAHERMEKGDHIGKIVLQVSH